jgi:hypothetical protein
MSRRRAVGDSSLELLLDTICNTFGGVLFLAMLVSLMLTQTRRRTDGSPADPTPAVATADLTRLDTRREDLARELEALSDQVRQARRAARVLDVPDADELLAAMETAERQASGLEVRRTELLAAVASDQAAATKARAAKAVDERERRRLEEEAEQVRKRLAAATEDRESLVAAAIRIRDKDASSATVRTSGRAPLMRGTQKTEFGLLIRYGRLYLMKRLFGDSMVINTADFSLAPGLLRNEARAKPHAGVDLTSDDGLDAGLRRITADFPSSSWYVCLVVHPDSFEEYLTAKHWLVDHGYECRLFPTTNPVNDGGEVDVRVQ